MTGRFEVWRGQGGVDKGSGSRAVECEDGCWRGEWRRKKNGEKKKKKRRREEAVDRDFKRAWDVGF
jgi:hypothetical protein